MKTTRIYTCEDTIDGIFTAVYDAWNSRYGHRNIRIQEGTGNNFELFSEYYTVYTDRDKSRKVAEAIQKKISKEAFEMVCQAALSFSKGKGDAIYRFLIQGFLNGPQIVRYLNIPEVNRIYSLSLNVYNESHHYYGFLHFTELDGHILFAPFEPKNNIISLITPHFADRFPDENFIIFDSLRSTAAVHSPAGGWVLVSGENFNLPPSFRNEDEEIKKLWKTFFHSISIKDRENRKLQRQNMPLRFRTYMEEFHS